ncbi:pyrokinin-1 receptor-like isoform X1 [Amphibalanus amphitrite]|uniref:pyrokinin-1 receptor-like isoform X1 n=1 Tax=Amphibalanus amphitrite TaxID=1232801 RepID=UPI001C9210D6|nr:pyrokinin-1 receptor-like isoform X1 [Amphibalanus amphitrite]
MASENDSFLFDDFGLDFLNDSISSTSAFHNSVNDTSSTDGDMHTVIPMTVLYVITFLLSAVGNTVTCIVIVYNRYMHTATNYYLFSMAISDLLLLVTGLPIELYGFWTPGQPYAFGETFCIVHGLCAETSTNASILTIVFFTVERYMAICHPLIQQTMSSLPRTIRNIVFIWAVALLCACFPAAQFGIKHKLDEFGNIREETANCNVVRHLFPYVFEVSSVLFFVVPMMIITLLYVLIGLRLRRSGRSRHMSRGSMHGGGSGTGAGAIAARRAVIKMLVAVVVAFFICWAPFHAQRLLAISVPDNRSEVVNAIMQGLYRVSGVLYFVSTCVNPILYHIMSAKFRQAVRDTFGKTCKRLCCCSGTCDREDSVSQPSTNITGLTPSADGGSEKMPELLATVDPLLAKNTTVTRV